MVKTYPRTFVNDIPNINNPHDVDSNGKSVSLYQRIQTAFPHIKFKISLTPTLCTITFDIDLTGAEETSLDAIVLAHEQANGIINEASSLSIISPNGQAWTVTIDNDGILKTNQI